MQIALTMIKAFREFVMRGNVIDMAVGIIIGVAFGKIVSSLVSDVLMPPLGLAIGRVDFSNLFTTLKEGLPPGPYATLAAAQAAGAVTVNVGLFMNALISFLIVAFAVFLLVRAIGRFRKPAILTKECPYCLTAIALRASRCPQCTSTVATAGAV